MTDVSFVRIPSEKPPKHPRSTKPLRSLVMTKPAPVQSETQYQSTCTGSVTCFEDNYYFQASLNLKKVVGSLSHGPKHSSKSPSPIVNLQTKQSKMRARSRDPRHQRGDANNSFTKHTIWKEERKSVPRAAVF